MKLYRIMKVNKPGICALALVAVSFAQAQIPVTDQASIATAIANQVESIGKWAAQFEQLKQQIEQQQQQYRAVVGSRGMGSLHNNAAMRSTLPADWQQVLANVKQSPAYASERAKYPTLNVRPKTNGLYDVMASQDAVMDDLFTKASNRLVVVDSLTAQIDSASDPAAKSDLTNRLISEQNAIQANQNLVMILQTKQKQQLDAAAEAANKEYVCKEFKRSGC